mgnify:CR=1 FL=1
MIKKYYTFLIPCSTKFKDNKFSKKEIKEAENMKEYIRVKKDLIFRLDLSTNVALIIKGVFGSAVVDRNTLDRLAKGTLNGEEILKLLKLDVLYIDKNENNKKLSKMKIFKAKEWFLPYYATIEITNYCPLECAHCYKRFELSRKRSKHLFLDKKEILRRIKELNRKGIFEFEITGGEPLAHPEIEDIIKEAKRYGKIMIPTSCYYLNINALNSADEISVSLDGIGKFHDRFRGKDGLYRNVIKCLDILSDTGKKLYISSIIYDGNLMYLKHLIDIAKKYNATLILQRVVANQEFKLSEENRKRIISLVKKYEKSVKIRYKTILPPKEREYTYLFYGCNYGRKDLFVNFEGEILGCLYLRSSILFNKIPSVKEFNTVVEEKRKEYLKKFKKCSSCKFYNVCGGPCRLSKKAKYWNKRN